MTDSDERKANRGQRRDRTLPLRLAVFASGMFLFGFLVLPPLYSVFCDITGLGGRTNETPVAMEDDPDATREIRLEFMTTVNEYAPFEFRAAVDSMTVHPGGMYEATFVAKNLSNRDKIAQAVPSVAPAQAGGLLKKIDCFCFSQQPFAANEERELPVRFVIDRDLPPYIDTITLSYTFFDTARFTEMSEAPDDHGQMSHD